MPVFDPDKSTEIEDTGRRVSASTFADSSPSVKNIPVKNVMVAHDCPYTGKVTLCTVYHALMVRNIKCNLFNPFQVREAGTIINDIPMQHILHPVNEDHMIYDPETKASIRLSLQNTFSGFQTRPLTEFEVEHVDEYDLINLTPPYSVDSPWNPYDQAFSAREAEFLDCEGRLRLYDEGELRNMAPQDLLAQVSGVVTIEPEYEATATVLEYERLVSDVCSLSLENLDRDPANYKSSDSDPWRGDSPFAEVGTVEMELDDGDDDFMNATAASLSVFDDEGMLEALEFMQQKDKFAMAIGATYADPQEDELFESLGEVVQEAAATFASLRAGNSRGISAESLAKVWRINQQDAERTLNSTTQRHQQNLNTTLSRQFGTNDCQVRYNRLAGVFFTDTFFVKKKAKSTRGYTCCQVFVSDMGFIFVYCMEHQRHYEHALKAFSKEVGAPDTLVCDPHPSQISKKVRAYCQKIGTTLRALEARTQWADRAELYVGLLKEAVRKDLRESNAPLVLWDYAVERRALISNATAKNNFKLQGQTAHAKTLGEPPDISNLRWGFYEWCYYRDNDSFPFPREVLGRVLGPTKNAGNEMCQWVLNVNGNVLPRRSLRRLRADELRETNLSEARKRHTFDTAIYQRLGNSYTLAPPRPDNKLLAKLEEVTSDDDLRNEMPYTMPPAEGSPDVPVADLTDATGKPLTDRASLGVTDTLIGAEVVMEGEKGAKGICKVIRRHVDKEGKFVGTTSDKNEMNTMLFDCMCWDGKVRQYAANIIAQNILQRCDDDGRYSCELKEIIGHRRDGDAVRKEEMSSREGSKSRKSTKGWYFNCRWRDGSSEWISLADLKESYPVDVAVYVRANGIADEPAFQWWVPHTLRKADAIISAVKASMKKKNMKYGVRVPRNYEEAIRLDTINGNDLWRKAYEKEMANVGIAFQILAEGKRAPVGWRKSSVHLVFDVKMTGERKARLVKDGHRTPDPETSSYAGVVSRESVRIALTYASLMNIPVCAADIRNAYLSAKSSEEDFVICGKEFGLENVGRVALIRRALYGGKVAGRDYWLHMRKVLSTKLGFQSSRGDPDVWYREARRVKDNSPYYEYVLIYTDDILVISDRAEEILREEIGKGEDSFELKPESIGKPSQYLGGKLSEVKMNNGQRAWSFSSGQYVRESVKNVETYLESVHRKLPRRANTPLSQDYRPEVDVSAELSPGDAAYYQSLIGMLRWMVELGRIDICLETSMMSSHLALPREGHLLQVLHIFAYLKNHPNSAMVFDPTEWDVPAGKFKKEDWRYSIYGCEGLTEKLPDDMPKPLGKGMRLRVYVDSDHAGDQLTRKSRTGFIVFLNSAPIYWYSKRQGSLETSTYGAEFIAMKQACEYVRGLRYKLRSMGIPVDEPAFIFGDNQSVLHNTTKTGAVLKKKSSAIAFHYVREGVSRDEWRTEHISTHKNIADLLTKPLADRDKRWTFIATMLAYVAPAVYYK